MDETQIDFNEARLKARIAFKEQQDTQARRTALLEEVIDAILLLSKEHPARYSDLYDRVRAEWGGMNNENQSDYRRNVHFGKVPRQARWVQLRC